MRALVDSGKNSGWYQGIALAMPEIVHFQLPLYGLRLRNRFFRGWLAPEGKVSRPSEGIFENSSSIYFAHFDPGDRIQGRQS